MRSITLIFITSVTFLGCKNEIDSPIIGTGQMPNTVMDISGNIHLVYGNGDSILYCYSSDKGKSFSQRSLVSVVPRLAASHMRGPQIAAVSHGLIVTACNELGDIFSFAQEQSGKWSQSGRVNDTDTTAKENLMGLAGDGESAFAVWLDLRDQHNKIFGARSSDGGKTWSKNTVVYASPDTTVCECCKPSVQVKGKNVYVMFRNWLDGNRDLYLIQSSDGGSTFGQAEKLGIGSWSLNGCPMDGGAMAIDKNGQVQTVWRRKKKIYACEPGKAEKEIGEGKNCTIESVNGKNIYAWVENGNVIVMKPGSMKENLGKGQQPILNAVNNQQVLCVWEHENRIHRKILEL